jgi:predicted small metal-binding protein
VKENLSTLFFSIKRRFTMAQKQYKQLGCLDVDPRAGCAFQVRAETEEEIMRLGAEHGKLAHKMDSMPPDMLSKVKAAIKTVTVDV